jgi:hypothetical protein
MAPSAWLREETPRVSSLRLPRYLFSRGRAIHGPVRLAPRGNAKGFLATLTSHPCSVSSVGTAGPSMAPSAWLREETPRVSSLRLPRIHARFRQLVLPGHPWPRPLGSARKRQGFPGYANLASLLGCVSWYCRAIHGPRSLEAQPCSVSSVGAAAIHGNPVRHDCCGLSHCI